MSQFPGVGVLDPITDPPGVGPGPSIGAGLEGHFQGVIDAMRVNGTVTIGGHYPAAQVTYDWKVWPNPYLSYQVVANVTAGTPAGVRHSGSDIVPAAAGDPCDVFVQAGKIKFQVKEGIFVGC